MQTPDDELKAFMAALNVAPVTPDRPAHAARDIWWRSRMRRVEESEAARMLERGVAATVGLTALAGLAVAAFAFQPGAAGVLLILALLGLSLGAFRQVRRG